MPFSMAQEYFSVSQQHFILVKYDNMNSAIDKMFWERLLPLKSHPASHFLDKMFHHRSEIYITSVLA